MFQKHCIKSLKRKTFLITYCHILLTQMKTGTESYSKYIIIMANHIRSNENFEMRWHCAKQVASVPSKLCTRYCLEACGPKSVSWCRFAQCEVFLFRATMNEKESMWLSRPKWWLTFFCATIRLVHRQAKRLRAMYTSYCKKNMSCRYFNNYR